PYSRGYLAIIESGTSFAYITACLGQTAWVNYASANCEYNTVYASFTVKQTDTVSLGSSLGNASEMTTSINTKYTGNYAIRFILLSDPNLAKSSGFESYEPSYVGMANAYRDYLERTGAITRLTAEEVKNGVPLYIQSFGALDTDDTFLSIPIVKRVALTTFDDVETMSSRLKEAGILNQNYILTAFANGTLEWQDYPSALRWERVVGGRSGLKDLIQYASEEGIHLFPNFDFANVMRAAGGFRFRRHASQTMSGRYVTKRTYDPVFQRMGEEGFSNLVSASAFQYLYNRFAQKYNKLNAGGLAVLTLGNDLNSDFNVDNALTREDSKEYTIDLLAKMAEDNGHLLVSGGNAYVLPYVTDMIDVSMYNSRFEISSASVPFVGMVLHGFVNFAGTPVNMAGDLMYEILKSIESGSALYFILSYQNTNKLKEGTELASEYYSVNFDTWYPDVVKYYTIVNDAIGNLQDAMITDHEAVTAFRLNSEDAYTLFRQLEDSEKTYQTTRKAYYDSIANSDRIIADQRDPLSALAAETANRIAFETATKRYELVKGMIATNSASDVVSVTYTAANGKETVFFINYNSFDVAIYVDGKVCRLAPNSFVTKDQLTGENFVISDAETVTAWLPTTKGIANYRTMQETMNAALESGSTAKINRAQTNLSNAISVMATNTSDVVMLNAADGSQFFVNYTQSIVLVRISDTRYEIISPRSYLKID
ncbi:MAG: hypothetical protein KBS76_02990, partial [Ruminococcus sp.]|nr:hypothetical protein [Candidatus Apopatosoma intestinale]